MLFCESLELALLLVIGGIFPPLLASSSEFLERGVGAVSPWCLCGALLLSALTQLLLCSLWELL